MKACSQLSSNVFCLDIEASGFGDRGYPIEIGIVDVRTKESLSWLIRPTQDWQKNGFWSLDSAQIHGISMDVLMQEGLPVKEVALALSSLGRNCVFISDAVKYDRRWLSRFWAAAEFSLAPFEPECFHEFVEQIVCGRTQEPDQIVAKAKEEALMRYPQQHRAVADARRNAEVIQILRDWTTRNAVCPVC